MGKRPEITTQRAVEVYEEMIVARRDYCADHEFFKMPDVWNSFLDDEGRWQVRTYNSNRGEDYDRRAGVIVFDDRLRLTVDAKFWEKAKQGCTLANFTLAHELGHIALNHHSRNAVVKNFQLFENGSYGMSNIPPTLEELEANFAAVFFQCGVALADSRWNPKRLAQRACSDITYVVQAQKIVGLEVFQRELNRWRPSIPRAVF
ncbi:MAG: ImmA/IrrE family metallo-endopeptidase [Cypionkella sp.]|jgi:hypothetical protein